MFVKKLASLSLALALVYSISLPARAELVKNFKADGSIETRVFGIDNETDRDSATDDYRSEVNTRLMLGGSFDLLDDVHARILLRKNNRQYGNAGEDLNTVQSNLVVDNAYAKIDKVFGHMDLTMGRQFYGNPNDLVIYFGPTNDEVLSVTAVDLFRADMGLKDFGKLQLIAGKIADTSATGATANTDTDIYGGQVETDYFKVLQAAAGYYIGHTKNDGAEGNDLLNVLDLVVHGDIPKVAGLSYRAELMLNGGRDNSIAGDGAGYDGDAYFLALAFGQSKNDMPIRASAEWGKGSATFEPIAAEKRFGLIWGQHSNVGPSTLHGGASSTGLSNLEVMDLSAGVTLMKKLGIDASWYYFQKADKLSGVNPGLSNLGTEYDLVVSWKHSDNVTLEANAASFQLGDALRNAPGTGSSPILRIGGDVKIKF